MAFENSEIICFEASEIAEAFEKYGWSFVEALWVALHRADGPNTIKILTAWENYASEYIETFLYSKKQNHAK